MNATSTMYDTGTFTGGRFANDPTGVRHVAAVEPDSSITGAGRRGYRILLNGIFAPKLTVESATTIRIVEDGDWNPEGCVIVFTDGCDTTAVKATDGPVGEVHLARWTA